MTDAAQGARIFLIDDHHPAVRKGVKHCAYPGGSRVCGEADSAARGPVNAPRVRCKIAFLDLSLGDGSGLDLIPAICGLGIPVLIYSMHEDGDTIQKARGAGALGYVSKRERRSCCGCCNRNCWQGRAYLEPPASPRHCWSVLLPSVARQAEYCSANGNSIINHAGPGGALQDMAAALASASAL